MACFFLLALAGQAGCPILECCSVVVVLCGSSELFFSEMSGRKETEGTCFTGFVQKLLFSLFSPLLFTSHGSDVRVLSGATCSDSKAKRLSHDSGDCCCG